MKIVTYNVRCVWKDDGPDGTNGFINRAGMAYEKISEEMPDVIGFQECHADHVNFLKRVFPEYLFLGHFRNADYDGEGVFTAFLKDKYDLLAYETFWISPTPYVSGSRFKIQSDCPRTCVMTQIRCKKTGEIIRILNLHLDHISDEARVHGMDMIMDKIDEYNAKAEYPTVILGDFNARPESSVIKLCNSRFTDVTANLPVTFHNYGRGSESNNGKGVKIDYIFVSDELAKRAKNTVIWDECIGGIYLSDHYPVCAEFKEN